ncbi:MAG: flagellar hook-basal body complex protein [Gammaproteobacteria bacterium]|nr:flagellar hook-basal body complex protein [Gammaproteobacteria bacterium]MBU1553563.1 flagellar hook-basal body complex protein [Gammaproteobacteria bacterium]MBU2070804.1 flagellar hook-basal body complex protein [Gammaproteobacteria bacterium]MBU2182795.1 flagellar hook-basal body complex protein [Gammaproteobacteria bacterium]MBU2205963.1 flagellar hook-basal body complex protein [Gammaproteobacteria bacterium]
MSMFNIGLSGLKTTQKALEVTSNNIANSATAGFKSGSAEFAAVYNGGQRGGVGVSDIKENFAREGNVVNTGSALDLAITGKGFFVVSENGRMAYTQAGQFGLDKEQHIVNASGNRLQGYGIDANGNLIPGVLTDLKVEAANIPAEATTEISFALNLSSASDVIAVPFDPLDGSSYNYSQSTEMFDSLGNSHTLTQYFVHNGAGSWDAHYYVNGTALPAPFDTAALSFDVNGQLTVPAAPANIALEFAPAGAALMSFNVNMTASTQFGSGFNIYNNDADGYTAGEFAGVSIAETGQVFATFTNGETKLQGQVVLANFANVNGLETGNKTVWYATNESGAPLYGTPDSGNLGALLSGAYIGSNVDISEQLVDLMAFQQNYQANAKTISNADEMMQILFSAT